MDRKIKIGCIGPSDSMALVREVAERYYPHIELIPYVEERLNDAWKALDRCQEETEGILFTGIGVQEAAKARGEVTRPHEHIPRGGYSLTRALWQMDRGDFQRISIDVVTEQVLADVVREFDIQFEKIYTMPFDRHHGEDEYENRHIHLFESGRVDAIISGFGAVYESLKQRGYPVFRLYPGGFQIRENMDHLLERIRAGHLKSAGIAIQIVKLAGDPTLNQYDDLKREGEFSLALLEYARALQGSLFNRGKEFVIYSTRGAVDERMNMAHFGRILAWARQKYMGVFSGIGVGITAFEAEKSARKALANAKDVSENAFFIADGDRMQGPLGEAAELTYPIRVADEKELKMAQRIGISPGYLSKIRALVSRTGKTAFDADDMAACLGISQRSARRVLKKFVDSGHGNVSGKETVRQVGRPKNLVKLKL